MEIRMSGERFIRLEFGEKGETYVEWSDGLTIGGRELCADADFAQNVREKLHGVLELDRAKECIQTQDGALQVTVEKSGRYFHVEMAYVPEDDLMPWQWLRVDDMFRQDGYEEFLRGV